MSNRSSEYRQENSSRRGYHGNTQKRYIPRTPNSPSPNTNQPALSASLRQSFPRQSPEVVSADQGSTSSRVRLGENGEWVSRKGNFVNYLPHDEAVAIGLGAGEGGLDAVESQRVVDLLNRELARLLTSNPSDFWREVATDASLHEFLDSFLQFRSRWYDFPYRGVNGIVAGVIVGDSELSRRVFFVLYRISCHRDPGVSATESLSTKDHEVLLQEKKLLDLPKLLDICTIYGHDNEDLTRSLVSNAMTVLPEILETFTAMMFHFLGIVNTMYQRCRSSVEALISGAGCEDDRSSRRHVEYLEVMDFLNDSVVSMDAFVTAYRPAAVFFSCPVDASHGNEELINILATLHDSLLPSLRQGFKVISAAGGDNSSSVPSDVSVSLKILSVRLVDLGWKLLDRCYLSEELFKDYLPFPSVMKMFPASVEDPVIRADILIQTLKEIAAVLQHAQGKRYKGTFLQNIEKKYQIMRKIRSLQQGGWLSIDDEQYQYLTGILTDPSHTVANQLPKVPNSVRSDGLKMEDVAIVESKISQVKDLFPDYGRGFISACLEVYDYNPEEVIQRILEETLHDHLRSLDTSMEILSSKPDPPLTKKDKGKGILVDPTRFPTTITNSAPQKQTPEAVSSSASSTGRFIRKSKADQIDDSGFGSKDEKHKEKTAALLSQYEYEDEYDDSFDDLGMTIVESIVEETEILGERVRSHMSISPQVENQISASGSAKWNSRKKPQFFVKDGKNYSYKVEGSVAVADQQQASLVTQAQKELIHGLGCGGNRPLGAVKKLEEQNELEGGVPDPVQVFDGSNAGRGRGRGHGRRGGGGRSHYRKDRAMKKHMAGLGGF